MSSPAPWFTPPALTLSQDTAVVVIGAGIAGSCVAHALARRGQKVLVLDQHQAPAQGTSGNPVGVILPFVSVKPDPMSCFFDAAYRFVQTRIKALMHAGKPTGWQHSGVLHLLAKDRLHRLHDAMTGGALQTDLMHALNAAEAASKSGLPLTEPALYYPHGGYVSPPLFCKAHLNHPLIDLQPQNRVAALERTDKTWCLLDETGARITKASAVVLASGHRANFGEWLADLPIRKSRGQLMTFHRDHLARVPNCVICHKGYLVPGPGDQVLIGATWQKHEDTALLQEDQDELLTESQTFIPGFQVTKTIPLQGRTAFRARTPDHLPIVGPVPHWPAYQAAYQGLNHGKYHRNWPHAPSIPGLYASLGHGGRGMVSAPLSGEIVAAQILGETPPVEVSIPELIHPGRFALRRLKRGLPATS